MPNGGSMGAVVIRPVQPADQVAWQEMRAALWPEAAEGEHAAEIRAYFDEGDPGSCLVAIAASGGAVGFVELSIRPYAEGCLSNRVGFLEGWYVVPGWRRRGVGRALVEAGEGWARRHGCSEFGSDALIDNRVSRDAHRALGFSEVAEIVCFWKSL